jgi:hypothetical protein
MMTALRDDEDAWEVLVYVYCLNKLPQCVEAWLIKYWCAGDASEN